MSGGADGHGGRRVLCSGRSAVALANGRALRVQPMEDRAAYVEWTPARSLRRHVSCTWAGRFATDGVPYVENVLPDGCIDLVWDGERLFVAGPDTRPVALLPKPRAIFVGIRFWPGVAPTFLGVPSSELRDLRVEAGDVLGDRATMLIDRVAPAPTLRAAALELENALVEGLPQVAEPDPVVEAAVAFLARSSSTRPIAPLAARLGMDERQLHRRCTAGVGYGPKMLHRVLRLRRFLSLSITHPELGLAELAAAVGYADQAHLTRETQRLAGASPRALVRSRRTEPLE